MVYRGSRARRLFPLIAPEIRNRFLSFRKEIHPTAEDSLQMFHFGERPDESFPFAEPESNSSSGFDICRTGSVFLHLIPTDFRIPMNHQKFWV
jgi:hypothetical protein